MRVAACGAPENPSRSPVTSRKHKVESTATVATAPATEPNQTPGLAGPDLLRRTLLVLVTTLLVARPAVLGEDPGLFAEVSDPQGMVLTLLWLLALVGWAGWRFWSQWRTPLSGEASDRTHAAQNWYGGAVQAALLATVVLVFLSAEVAARYLFPARLIAWEWVGMFAAFFVVQQLAVSPPADVSACRQVGTPTGQHGLFAVLLAGAVSLAAHGVYQERFELPRSRQALGDESKLREAMSREGYAEEMSDTVLRLYRKRIEEQNIFGPYAHPNTYAGFLILWLPGLVGAVWMLRRQRVPAWQTALAAGCALLGAVALWLTHSRGALLGLILAGLGAAVLVGRGVLRRHLVVALVSLLILGGAAFAVYRSGLLNTLSGKEERTASARLEYWGITWQMIRDRPWLGVGPGNFGQNYTRFMSETAGEQVKDPHNFALEMWATCGLFALLTLVAALLAFFVAMIRWLLRQYPADPRPAPEAPPDEPALPPFRLDFYIGGMFGLLLAFVLRVNTEAPESILPEAWAAALRSVVWFAAYGLLERVAWTDRARALALTTGVAALVLNLCVSGGIGSPSLAALLWVAVALALNTRGPSPVRWLSVPGVAGLLPLPVLAAVTLFYVAYLFYPVMSSDNLQHEVLRNAARLMSGDTKPLSLKMSSADYLRKKIIDTLVQAARLTPDDARLQVRLAHWYGRLWQINRIDPQPSDLAIAHALEAARLNPLGGQGYLAAFNLCVLFGNDTKKVAEETRGLDPLKVHELKEKARVAYQKGARVLERFLPNDPNNAVLRYQVAWAWFQAGDTQEGRKQAGEALRLDDLATWPTRKLTSPQRKEVRQWLEWDPLESTCRHASLSIL